MPVVTRKFMTIGSHLEQMFRDGRVISLACALVTLFVISVAILKLAFDWFDSTRDDESSDAKLNSDVETMASVVFLRVLAYLINAVVVYFMVGTVTGGVKTPEVDLVVIQLGYLTGVVTWVLVPGRMLSLNMRSAITVCFYELLIAGALVVGATVLCGIAATLEDLWPAAAVEAWFSDPGRWRR
jgi:hypothetical protein